MFVFQLDLTSRWWMWITSEVKDSNEYYCSSSFRHSGATEECDENHKVNQILKQYSNQYERDPCKANTIKASEEYPTPVNRP